MINMLPGIGVFGTGHLVKVIVPLLKARGFKVEALWGFTLDEAESRACDLGIPFYTNIIDEVLLKKEVRMVFILCPPSLHGQIALKALGIGKHVLCDTPTGLSQNEIYKMKNAAQYYPLISIINFGLRFLPAFIQMKKAIADKFIGDISMCDIRVQCGSLLGSQYNWLCDDVMGGGVLFIIGSHLIDIVSYLTNMKALRVHGMLRTFCKTTDNIKGIRRISSDDFCSFQMEMPGGFCCNVTLNSHVPGNFTQEVLICGSQGRLAVKGGDLYGQKLGASKEEVLYLDVEDMQQIPQDMLPQVLPKPYLKGMYKMVGNVKDAFCDGSSEQLKWFKDPVSMAASFEDGQYVQAVIEAIRMSSRTREWTRVNMLSETDPAK